jgi:hypothetical protein
MDRLRMRARAGSETVSFESADRRGVPSDQVLVRIEPDDQLDAGYYEAFARLDRQSLGRLLHWLQTGEALPRDDVRIPEVFTRG